MEEKDRGRREGKKWMSRRKNQFLLIWNLWVNRSSPSSSSTVQPLFMQLNQSGVEPDPPPLLCCRPTFSSSIYSSCVCVWVTVCSGDGVGSSAPHLNITILMGFCRRSASVTSESWSLATTPHWVNSCSRAPLSLGCVSSARFPPSSRP